MDNLKSLPLEQLKSRHTDYMKAAIQEAEKAFSKGEIPVGAVIVHKNKIIAKGHNLVERLKDPTAHAEMITITAASNYLSSSRLEECTLYVTLEPCPMCAGAIVLAKLPTLVFGTFDPKAGACGTLYNIVSDERLNHRVHVISGILDNDSEMLLKEFFRQRRLSQ
ncbi:MAG: tRNA adenosine(34) deaminase TadA [Bacteroidetes bacterium]|nr:tRNA adenosine(34) deaminase TadA [Bacteroidota bacterium]